MRRMVWFKSEKTRGWVCSDCAWAFDDTGPPQGNSIKEMAENFERERDREFASHLCAKYPKRKSEGKRTTGEES